MLVVSAVLTRDTVTTASSNVGPDVRETEMSKSGDPNAEPGRSSMLAVSESSRPAPRHGIVDWQLVVPLAIAAGFVWERSRNIAYARYFSVPSQFVAVDPRQALVTLSRYVIHVLAACVAIAVVLTLVRIQSHRDSLGWPGWWTAEGRISEVRRHVPNGVLRLLAAIVLLVLVGLTGTNAGRQDAQRQDSFIVVQDLAESDSLAVVVYISGDTLILRTARPRAGRPAAYMFDCGFTVRKLDATPLPLLRRKLGQIGSSPGCGGV
jgi:hypothetical protein